MKKFLTMLLAAAMLFALAACGTTPNETGNDNNTQDGHQAETPDTPYETPQIAELYSEDFDYTDGVGNSGHYTLSLIHI